MQTLTFVVDDVSVLCWANGGVMKKRVSAKKKWLVRIVRTYVLEVEAGSKMEAVIDANESIENSLDFEADGVYYRQDESAGLVLGKGG